MVSEFLRKIAAAIQQPVDQLRLVRYDRYANQSRGKWVEVDDNNAESYLKPDYGYGAALSSYSVRLSGKDVLSFGLYQFPSCCAFCVSTGAVTNTGFRGRGLNIIANQFRQDLAKYFGYASLICTDVADNEPERKTLARNGFKDIHKVVNPRTGNTVIISIKDLE